MVDIFDSARSYSDPVLEKMTRRKNSPQKKEPETILSATELQNMDYNLMSESQFRSSVMPTGGSGKKHKGFKRLHDYRI